MIFFSVYFTAINMKNSKKQKKKVRNNFEIIFYDIEGNG